MPFKKFLERKDALGQRSHNLTRVSRNDAAQSGDTSRDGLCAQEAEDSKHGSTSVIDLLDESSSLFLFGVFLVETKGVVQVQGSTRDVLGIKCWELSYLTATLY